MDDVQEGGPNGAPCDSFNIPKNKNATTSPQSKYAREHDSDTEHEDRKKHTICSMEKPKHRPCCRSCQEYTHPQVDVREHVFHLR